MILFHRTTEESAAAIIENGFADHTGNYLTESSHTGVWLSDVPLDINEGPKGDVLLEVALSIPENRLSEYEWAEDWRDYREFLVPAELINLTAKVRIISEDEEEDMWMATHIPERACVTEQDTLRVPSLNPDSLHEYAMRGTRVWYRQIRPDGSEHNDGSSEWIQLSPRQLLQHLNSARHMREPTMSDWFKRHNITMEKAEAEAKAAQPPRRAKSRQR
jgi:hypothetical protein